MPMIEFDLRKKLIIVMFIGLEFETLHVTSFKWKESICKNIAFVVAFKDNHGKRH